MGEAIEVHVDLHLKGVNGRGCSDEKAGRLRGALIIQVLKITEESEDEIISK